MTMRTAAIAAALIAGMPTAAIASNDAAEFWINPSVSVDLDDNTGIEIETAQRLRGESDGRVDTYFGRFWINQQVSDAVTLSTAVERRINVGGSDETRTMQQMSTRHGILRTRLRLEQRFVDSAERMGLRLRPRVGVSIPLDEAERLSFKSDAELFVTLRANNPGSANGLTGLRTSVGFGYDITDRLSASIAYLRQQDIDRDGPDDVGHAPLFGIEFAF